MKSVQDQIISCTRFEELLTDYLDKALDATVQRSVAEHAIACPLCHTLLNDVRESLDICHSLAAPKMPMTRLEARILSMTTPDAGMACNDFEEHLSDYLDGFLPANVFHRWERHAVVCNECEDLPGMVVRSIAACYTYKLDEIEVPAGMLDRILEATIGTAEARAVRASWGARIIEAFRGFSFPIPVPQLASVAAMLLVAFMVFSQTVSADGSLTSVYQKSVELAEATYKQGADAINGGTPQSAEAPPPQEPVTGTTFTGNEENK